MNQFYTIYTNFTPTLKKIRNGMEQKGKSKGLALLKLCVVYPYVTIWKMDFNFPRKPYSSARKLRKTLKTLIK